MGDGTGSGAHIAHGEPAPYQMRHHVYPKLQIGDRSGKEEPAKSRRHVKFRRKVNTQEQEERSVNANIYLGNYFLLPVPPHRPLCVYLCLYKYLDIRLCVCLYISIYTCV